MTYHQDGKDPCHLLLRDHGRVKLPFDLAVEVEVEVVVDIAKDGKRKVGVALLLEFDVVWYTIFRDEMIKWS